MKLNLPRKKLLDLVSSSRKTVTARGKVDIASTILLKGTGKAIVARLTDTMHWLTAGVPDDNEFDPIAVNAENLEYVLRGMSGERVVVEAEDRHFVLKCKGQRRKLPQLSADKYPEVPIFELEDITNIDSELLISAMKRCMLTVGDPHGAHQQFAGINFHEQDGEFSLVSYDGASFTLVKCGEEDEFDRFMLPNAACTTLLAALPKKSTSVAIKAGPRGCQFSWAGCRLRMPIMENNFPEYGRLLDPGPHELVVDADELSRAFAVVEQLGDQDRVTGRSRLLWRLSEPDTRVEANSLEGSAIENIEGTYSGSDKELMVSSVRVLWACECFAGKEMSVTFGDQRTSPIIFNDGDQRVTCAFAPMSA